MVKTKFMIIIVGLIFLVIGFMIGVGVMDYLQRRVDAAKEKYEYEKEKGDKITNDFVLWREKWLSEQKPCPPPSQQFKEGEMPKHAIRPTTPPSQPKDRLGKHL